MSDNQQNIIEKWKNSEIFTFGKEVKEFFKNPDKKTVETVQNYAEKVSGWATVWLMEKGSKLYSEKTPKIIQKVVTLLENWFGLITKLKEKFLGGIDTIRGAILGGLGSILGFNFEKLLEKGKDKATQVAEEVKNEVEEKVEWLEEKIDFTERKKDFLKYLKDHNITAPEWLNKLSSAEVVKKLGLSPEDNTWQQYLKEGGFALLIYKFAWAKGLALNAGVYLGLVKRWPDSLWGKLLLKCGKELDDVKRKFFAKYPHLEYLAPEFLTGSSLEWNLDLFLEWIKDNPELSMASVNGMWFFRGFLVSLLKQIFKSVWSAIWSVMGYWFDHPIPGTIVATVTAYGYMERKQIVDEILDFTYENGETAQKNALRVNLYDWLGIETSQKKYTEEEKESSLKTLSQKENLEKACIMDSMLQEIGLWEDTKTKTLAYALLNITETTYTEEESKPILTKFKLEEGKDKQIWIDALVEKIYGEEKTRKKLNARLKLYDWALIKEWATNTLDVEYKIILEEVIGDPVKAINEYWPRIWELIKSWKWAFGINDVGELFCFAGTLSLPIQLGDIAKEQYKLITHAFFSDENQGGVMIPVTTGAVTCIVFGKMSFRGFQAYGEIIKKAKGAENYAELLPKLLKWEWTPSTLWRLLKTNGLFLTKDGRYVINSTLRWFPGAESLYLQRKALHIKESLNTIDDIKDLLWELDQHSKDLKTAIDYDLPEETKKYKELIEFKKNKIKTLTSKIKDKLELHSFAEKSSKKWLWSHLFETKYIKRLKTIAAELDSISTNTVTNDYEWARKLSTEVGKSLWRYQTRLSSLLSYSPVGLARKILIEPPSSKKLEKKVNKGRNKIVKSGENFNKMINVADEAIDEAERLEEIAQRSGKAKDIKKAEEAKKLADRLTRAVELGREAQEKAHAAEQAMQAAHDAQELAEAGRDTLNSTRLAKDAEEAYKIAREAANEARNAERAAAAARFNKLREIINKGGKIADIGGKTLGVIGAWVNVGTGGYEIYKGLANENEAQGNIQIAQGGVKVTSGWIEAATLTTAWALGGLIVANVEIYKYMINKGLESAAEATMTSDDWANKETNTLIHDLLSTVDDINAGDAYRAFASLKTSTEDILKEKIETRQKIIEALILKEGISDQAIIADRINFFTDTSVEFNFNDRDTFLKLLNQSRTYAQAMQYARQEKADGKTEVILELNQHRNINLLDPKTKKIRIAHAFQKLQKKEITPKIPETRLANFEKLDETTILYMLNCLGSYLASKQNEKTTEIENFHKELELYAKGVRNIFFQPRIIQNVTKEEIDKFISLTAEENATPKKMEENIHDIENTPEAFALFEVAKMFDYSGKGKITDLQNFFSENKKGEHGIYWNGEEWVVNEAGLERDDKMGNNGKRTIHNMINRIRDNQNDILETRNNELVDIRTTYSEEKMGNFALEIAEKLEEGMERYKQNN